MTTEYIPARTTRGSKANVTKRSRWERLVNDSAAVLGVRTILALEDVRWHADGHISGFTGCADAACPYRQMPAAWHAHEALQTLTCEQQGAWCKRFGVTMGYFLRMRARLAESRRAYHERETAADRAFSDADRAALREWLHGDGVPA